MANANDNPEKVFSDFLQQQQQKELFEAHVSLAMQIRNYFCCLRDAGFTIPQAMTLTCNYQACVIGNAFLRGNSTRQAPAEADDDETPS